jgi:hypothetical protein
MGSEENEQLQLRLRVQQILLMCDQSALLQETSLPVAKFKREFDMVIIDTPPMVQMPGARSNSRHSGRTHQETSLWQPTSASSKIDLSLGRDPERPNW